MDSELREASEPEILRRLALGESLVEICSAEGMPNRATVQRWQNADSEFDAAVTRAREDGYSLRAANAVRKAQAATDAGLGRLAFDAERWYLGKLSNAFSENKPQKHDHDVTLNVIERHIVRPNA